MLLEPTAKARRCRVPDICPVGYGIVPLSPAVSYPPTTRRSSSGCWMPYPPSPRTCHTGVLEATMSELLSTPTMSTLASSASSVRAPRGSGGKRRVSCHAAGAGAARPSRPSSCGLGRRSVVGMRGTEKTVGAREPARRPNHTPPPRQHSPRGRLDPYPPTFSRVHYHTLPGKNPEPRTRDPGLMIPLPPSLLALLIRSMSFIVSSMA